MSILVELGQAAFKEITTYLLEANYKRFALYAGWVTQGVNTYLLYRQLKALERVIAASPCPLERRSPLSIRYRADRFAMISGIARQAILTVAVQLGLHRRLWDIAITLPRVLSFGRDPTLGQAAQSILTLTLFTFYEQIIDFPFMVYSLCFIQYEFPLGRLTPVVGKLAIASAKACGHGAVFGALRAGLILFAGGWIGNRRLVGFMAIWYFSRSSVFALAYLFPSIIRQAYKEIGPLPEGELRDRVKILVERVGYPLTKLFVVESSGPDGKAVHKQNAQCLGLFGFKYITVTQALIQTATPEEAAATIAHELGHWSLSHTTKAFLLKEPKAFVLSAFYFFMENPRLFQQFGFDVDSFARYRDGRTAYPPVIAFLLYQMVGISVQPLYRMIRNGVSQYHEYQADRFAVEMGYGEAQCTGLRRLGEQDSLGDHDDWLFLLCNYSHPKVSDRIDAIRRYMDTEKGQRPEIGKKDP